MTIKGYNDTLEHTAALYAVNRSQELSDPVEIKFHPSVDVYWNDGLDSLIIPVELNTGYDSISVLLDHMEESLIHLMSGQPTTSVISQFSLIDINILPLDEAGQHLI